MIGVFVALAVFIGGLILVAFLPSLVARLVEGWAWLYTARLPSDIRARRRAEMRSDLWEHARAERELGYRPESIALHQFLRCLFGIPADLSWRRAGTRRSRHLRRRLSQHDVRSQREVAQQVLQGLQHMRPIDNYLAALKFDIELPKRDIAGFLDLSAWKGISELQYLDPLKQNLAALKFDIELPKRDIAGFLDLSASNVRVEMDRALSELRNGLAHAGTLWLHQR